jgi:hypothetical protein
LCNLKDHGVPFEQRGGIMVCRHQSEKRTELFSCLLLGDVDETTGAAIT